MEEIQDLIDEDDNVIGSISREEVKENAILHRGSAVFVFNSKGEILIHKRPADKKVYPSMWDFVLGGGVIKGETYEEAAKREALEEGGVKDVPFEFILKFKFLGKKTKTMGKLYKCTYDGPVTFQKEEIVEGRFVTIDELERLIKELSFCPDTLSLYNIYKERKGKTAEEDKIFVIEE